MRLMMLKYKRWSNTDIGSKVLFILRLLPWILIVGGMKLYVIMLLVNSQMTIDQDYISTNEDQENGHSLQQLGGIETQDKEQLEKFKIFAKLNETTIETSGKNRTPENTIWLFFNRVSRTGGQTVVELLKYLGEENSFVHQEHIYRTPWQRLMTAEEQKNLATWFEYNIWPRSYDRFSLFINFTQIKSSYEKNTPAYMSMVRDPVEKFISYFRFKRFDSESVKLELMLREKQKPGSGRVWYWKKIESCIMENDPECALSPGTEDFTSSIPFFCGQHEQCLLLGDNWALQQAKFNVEYEYSVVGLLEHWNTTLGVLQEYLPLFFKGAIQRYWSQAYDNRIMKKSPRKNTEIPIELKQTIKNKLANEYEFYEFLQQRLYKQYSLISTRLQNTSPLPPRPTTIRDLNGWERLQLQLLNKSKSR